MKFAFDLDGTLNRHTAQLPWILLALKNYGQEIVVLTAVPPEETREHRREMLGALSQYISDSELVLVADNAGRAKAEWCRDNHVAILFDDSPGNISALKQYSPHTIGLLTP